MILSAFSLRLHGDQQLRRESHSGLLSFDMESSIKVCWSRHNPIREHWVRKEGWPLHLCCQNNYHGVGKLHGGPTQIVNRLEKNDVVLPQQNSRITHIRIILKMCFLRYHKAEIKQELMICCILLQIKGGNMKGNVFQSNKSHIKILI